MVSIPKSVPNLKHRSASEDSCNGSWDMSIQTLSESLSQICSSPTQSHGTSFHDFMKNRQSAGSQFPNQSPCSSGENLSSSPSEKLDTPVFLKSGRKSKKVRVRHEESKRKLHEQLVAIIGTNSKMQNGRLDTNNVIHENGNARRLSRPDIKREELTKRFKLTLNLGDVLAEQLAIQISDSLSIYNCQNDAHERISMGELPDGVDVQTVMCLVDGDELTVKQYPHKYLDMDYPPSTARYLPIMQQDDAAGSWQMFLHVPGCYDVSEINLSLRTMDDKLIVKWNCDSFGESLCRLSMGLPPHVVSRSVSAAVTEDNQLILEALLARKRNRCLTL